jgi:hypothetical protein
MTKNLYRFYLYVVFIAMLIFAAVGLGRLLQALFSETPLRGAFGAGSTTSDLVQAIVFFVVSWIVAAILGGLHYWLIRRDMRSDPTAGSSAIRAFFLNIVELFATPLAVLVSTFFVIDQLGQNPASDVTGAAAFAIATLFLVAVLEWERQQTQAGPGAAILFQRLHLYGTQLILLILLTIAWFGTVSKIVDVLVFGGHALGVNSCNTINGCQESNLLSQVAGMLWVVLFWIGYGFVARRDTSSLFRQVLHYASFAYGVGLVLYGIERAIEVPILALLNAPVSNSDFVGAYDFTSPITLGLLVALVYILWLRMAAQQQSPGEVTTTLIAEAITAALLSASFWWGLGLGLLNVFETLSGSQPGPHAWAPALAFIITGVAYIPLDLHLHSRYVQDTSSASGPRHGFVFALLGGSILAGAIGGAVALYALATALLGSPFNGWQHVARAAGAAFIVGVVMLGIYLWIAKREHLFGGSTKQPVVSPTKPVVKPTTIEEVLDELLAGKISRDEAAAQLYALTNTLPSNQ